MLRNVRPAEVLAAACLLFASYPLRSQVLPAQGAEQGSAVQESRPAPEVGQPKDRERDQAKDEDKADKVDNDQPLPASEVHDASLWQDPGAIGSKNLFYGQGGAKHQPEPPFTFLSEDTSGTNPKLDVKDAEGKKWRVKLGEEARPEVVASRLLWAVGYYANDDYLLHLATIDGLHLKRGSNRVHNDSQVIDVRFSRRPGGQQKIGTWQWKGNNFMNTREFNGLRVMMAVMNDWDLKDVNNAVYKDSKTGKELFLVSDVGATFATNSLQMTRAKDKGNVESYKNSKFITRQNDKEVDFGTPAPPTGVLIKSMGVMAGDYFRRQGFDWIGHNVPREDARWMGSLLGQLSHEQLTDAFRAGNFPAESIEGYVEVLESRIAELK
ncbi:MAG TPA: hypothetical protein VM865_04675, partial [Acidobacteriaceae bacterium]|nr:hypothetical protein [Acidobacteriaceae bacterium]